MGDQEVARQLVGVFDGRRDFIRLRIDVRRVQDIRRVLVVVGGPVRHGTQGGAGLEDFRGAHQGHQAHEAAIAAAIDAHIVDVALVLLRQPVGAVDEIVQFRVAHLAVDGRAPGAAVTERGAVVDVEHDIALLHQQVVEHLFAEIHGVALGHVLQVARAVREHDDRILFARLQLRRAIQLGPDGGCAMRGRHLHQLRHDPIARLEGLAARIRQDIRLAACNGNRRQLGRQIAGRIAQQQLAAIGRQAEVFHAFQIRHFACAAILGRAGAHFIRAWRLPVAHEIGALAVAAPFDGAHFPLAAGQGARRRGARLRVQVGVAAFLGQVPQGGIVGQPAKFLGAAVDPGRVADAVHGQQGAIGQVDVGEPAVLVVDGAHAHGYLAAVIGPGDAVALGVDTHGAVAFQRRQFLLGAQKRQRIDADTGQAVESDVAHLARAQVGQFQALRDRHVAAHARALVVRFRVARFRHVAGQFAQLALLGGLVLRDEQQPAAIRRQGAAGNGDFVAQVDRFRRARGVQAALCVASLAAGVALFLLARQVDDQAQLQFAQGVRFRLGVRVLGRAQQGHGGAQAVNAAPAEPVGAAAVLHGAAVGGILRVADGRDAARDLRQGAVFQVALEQVAVAQQDGARAGPVDEHLLAIKMGQLRVVDLLAAIQSGVRACHLIRVAQGRAEAFLFVIQLAIPAPPCRFDRCADPVGIGHGLVQGDRRGGGGGWGRMRGGQQR